jgi:hypothetical protein
MSEFSRVATRPNRRPFVRARVATMLLLAGVGLAACSSGDAKTGAEAAPSGSSAHPRINGSSPSSGAIITCTAENMDKWTGTPTNFRVERMAQQLGVAVEQVVDGAYIAANCAQGLPVADIAAGKLVMVSGIPPSLGVSNRCLPVGIMDVMPSSGAVSHHIRPVCPALPPTT